MFSRLGAFPFGRPFKMILSNLLLVLLLLAPSPIKSQSVNQNIATDVIVPFCTFIATSSTLDCSNERALAELPAILPYSTKILRMKGNNLSAVVSWNAQPLKRLTKLHLESTQLNDLSVASLDINAFIRLEKLNLSYNLLENINEWYLSPNHANHTTLTVLDLSNNRITSVVQNAFNHFVNLETLKLSNNRLMRICSKWQHLPNLVRLHLNSNHIHSIETSAFNNMTSLRVLRLNHNQLSNLQSDGTGIGLGAFTINYGKLEELYLRGNKITSLSTALIFALPHLKILNLQSNPVVAIESNVWDKMHELETLDLSRTNLCQIKPGMFTSELYLLKHLNLANSQISHITDDVDSFGDIPSLVNLSLSNNPLKEFPEKAFRKLTNLKSFKVGKDNQLNCCQLTWLIKWISSLSQKPELQVACRDTFDDNLNGHNNRGLNRGVDYFKSSTFRRICLSHSNNLQHQIYIERLRTDKKVWLLNNVTNIKIECKLTTPFMDDEKNSWLLEWRKDGKPLDLSYQSHVHQLTTFTRFNYTANEEYISRSLVIVLSDVWFSDEGTYKCTVRSGVTLYSQQKEVQIAVYTKPVFTAETLRIKKVTLRYGEPVMLSCNATAIPEPIIILGKANSSDNGSYPAVLSRELDYQQDKIWIKSVVLNDSGPYICTANNIHAISKHVIQLEVLQQPYFNASFNSTSAHRIEEGSNYTILCPAGGGAPEPNVLWYKDGRLYDNSNFDYNQNKSHLNYEESRKLVLNQVTTDHEGGYTCALQNAHGYLIAKGYFLIEVLPAGSPLFSSFYAEYHRFVLWVYRNFLPLFIIAVAIAFVLLFINIVACYLRSKKRKSRKNKLEKYILEAGLAQKNENPKESNNSAQIKDASQEFECDFIQPNPMKKFILSAEEEDLVTEKLDALGKMGSMVTVAEVHQSYYSNANIFDCDPPPPMNTFKPLLPPLHESSV